jgi:hypothetical protein
MARAGGDEGEGLDGDVDILKVGQVHVAAAAALEQGSVPEERIGMEISDNESVVQRLDAGRRVIRMRVQELIVPGFDDGWDFNQEITARMSRTRMVPRRGFMGESVTSVGS